MPLEAQDAWIEYISLFSDNSLKLSDLIGRGYSYKEAKEIFVKAIKIGEMIDIDTLEVKNSSTVDLAKTELALV